MKLVPEIIAVIVPHLEYKIDSYLYQPLVAGHSAAAAVATATSAAAAVPAAFAAATALHRGKAFQSNDKPYQKLRSTMSAMVTV